MLEGAAVALVVTVLFGAALASTHLRPGPSPGWLRAAHGGLGGGGFTLALLGLAARGGAWSAFVLDAVALLAAALALGVGYWRLAGRLGGQRGLVLMLHGFAGFVGAGLLAGAVFAR